MNKNVIIVAFVAAILAIGVVAKAASPVFADSVQVKQDNKLNSHINSHGSGSTTSIGQSSSNSGSACSDFSVCGP
jgi:hypothetical protein